MGNTRLEVSEEILDRVVYGMENQKEELFLDPEDGQLKEKGPDRKPLIPMPSWTPADGFRLMDSFSITIPDETFRKMLQDILHSGTGVFRRFKDSLKDRPGTEGLWRRYKQREMRKAAISWLSRWSDALELEALDTEPEEDLDDLSLSEFLFREVLEGDVPSLGTLVASAKVELQEKPQLEINSTDKNTLAWIAEAPENMAVGCAILTSESGNANSFFFDTIYVLPEFRGLGIGRKLTELALGVLGTNTTICMTSNTVSEASKKWLEELGFKAVSVTWERPGRK